MSREVATIFSQRRLGISNQRGQRVEHAYTKISLELGRTVCFLQVKKIPEWITGLPKSKQEMKTVNKIFCTKNIINGQQVSNASQKHSKRDGQRKS